MKPLRGVRVVEFAPHLPGQYLTNMLRHLGASIVKIEPPAGDSNRRLGPQIAPDLGFIFAASNEKKKLLRLDLRTDGGRLRAAKFIRNADLVVQAYRPSTAKKLGIDWAACRRLNPRVVYVELSGWGPKGPLAEAHGHDLAYQSAAGMLRPDAPQFPTTGVADLFGSLWGAVVGAAALTTPRAKRKAVRIPISLAGSALAASQLARAASYTTEGAPSYLTDADPYYHLYRCSDGRYLALACVEPPLMEAIRHVTGVADADDPHVLIARLGEAFATRTRDAWLRALGERDVPCAPVLSAREAPDYLGGAGAILPPHTIMKPPRNPTRKT